MAVHVPLGNAAILEAQMLMLASHNILNPANGAPITVPSQDMVLGLYYITKGRKSTDEVKVKGEGLSFYSSEEVVIAYNEDRIDLHAWIKVKANVKEDGELKNRLIETTVGRVLFNEVVPPRAGYINELLTKKSLREIIGNVLKETGIAIQHDSLMILKILVSAWLSEEDFLST
jgi:DNA-directed RNA polymerase subunit beta'